MAATLDTIRSVVKTGQEFTLDELMENPKVKRASGGDRKKVHMALYAQAQKPEEERVWHNLGDGKYRYTGDGTEGRRTGGTRKVAGARKRAAKKGTGMVTDRQRSRVVPMRPKMAEADWTEVGTDPHGHVLLCDVQGTLFVAMPYREHLGAS
jgi:hypothetical protein